VTVCGLRGRRWFACLGQRFLVRVNAARLLKEGEKNKPPVTSITLPARLGISVVGLNLPIVAVAAVAVAFAAAFAATVDFLVLLMFVAWSLVVQCDSQYDLETLQHIYNLEPRLFTS
jgi:hypothetical protein